MDDDGYGPALLWFSGSVIQKQQQFYSLKEFFNSAASGSRGSLATVSVVVGCLTPW